jgi:general secretion pathway protein K
MRQRRGVALLAALWLVVAIATVALQFSMEAKERRTLGIMASERGQQRALALGALAYAQAKLEYAIRVAPSSSNPNIARLAASDPWSSVDSLYTGTVQVDSIPVTIVAHDLGEKLNINTATETELQQFFSFLLSDYSKSTQLSQAIMDWRDADSVKRPSGAERDDYIKAGMLALPANTLFSDVSDLQNVMGMTPEIYAQVSPYLTTRGAGQINLNDAPVPVLRSLPGMTDATLNQILQLRSQGRRISQVSQIFSSPARGGRPLPGQLASNAAVNALQGRTEVNVSQVELTITARVGPQAQPTVLIAVVRNSGTTADVQSKKW